MPDITLKNHSTGDAIAHLETGGAIAFGHRSLLGPAARRLTSDEWLIDAQSIGFFIDAAEAYGLSFTVTSTYIHGRRRAALRA